MNDPGMHQVLKSFVSEFPEEFTDFDMENMEFQEAEANVSDLISEYDQYQENWNPGWGQRTFAHWLVGSGLDEKQIEEESWEPYSEGTVPFTRNNMLGNARGTVSSRSVALRPEKDQNMNCCC
eukprot:UN26844